MAASSVHILGTFNDWDERLWTSDPGMVSIMAGTWRDTIDIFPGFTAAGLQEFEFVTNRDWDDPTPDYVQCADRPEEYGPLAGPVCLVIEGPNISMYADYPGRYEITLDETALRYTARLVEPFAAQIAGTVRYDGDPPQSTRIRLTRAGGQLVLAEGSVSSSDNSFRLSSLDGGTYDLTLSAESFLTAAIRGVFVEARGLTNVGLVTMSPGCDVSQDSLSDYVQVVGDFNNWDPGSRLMKLDAECIWVDTLRVDSGCYFLKFRPEGDWNLSYGSCSGEDPACHVSPSGRLCRVGAPEGTAIGKVSFPESGDYEFRFNERALTYQIRSLTPTAVQKASWGAVKAAYR